MTRAAVWLLLALPGLWWAGQAAGGDLLPMDLLRPSGEMAVRLTVLALLPGPLSGALGAGPFLRAWLGARRWLGLAAFGYGLLHLGLYAIDMGAVSAMAEELDLPGIWTGWLALALMVPPAAISFDRAMRALGRRWKRVQRLVHAALFAALAHWVLLDFQWLFAALHLAPLALAWGLLLRRRALRSRLQEKCA